MTSVSRFMNDLTDAMRPLARSAAKAMAEVGEALSDAFAPLLARKRPYETGKELAELAAENNLTTAERDPVRAKTAYGVDQIQVEYDDGTGFEVFTTYSKDALNGGSDD